MVPPVTLSVLERTKHISIRHFRAFEAAGRLGSLNQAGDEVHMSQSTMTYALRQVEEMFRVRLMERDARGSRLTPEGEVVHARLVTFFELLNDTVVAALRPLGKRAEADLGRIVASISWLHIVAVAAFARLGDVDAAAQKLGISQASLLRRLREVGRCLGCDLFVRNAERLVLNRTGQAFARGLSLAAKELDYAVDELASLDESHVSTIALGCLGLARTALIPMTLSCYLSHRPSVRVRLVDDSFDVAFAKLCNGELDYLICAKRDDMAAHGIVGDELFSANYAIACRAGHPLTRVGKVTIADLLRHDWLLPIEGTPLRRACERIFEGVAFPSHSVIETQSAMTSFAILRSSDRLMISSWHDIVSNGQELYLSVLPYPLPIAARSIYLYRRQSFRPPPLHSELAARLRRRAAKFHEISSPLPELRPS
ncbi:LysR family transcriptional regulator [Chelativorans salis]|uniref:LysR family transcriptional regulator n=1 Tax=Chelativorans salis TaxID=2978478 RepID=A0ABT2LQ50_9HYPH|nr:LysR family transcriptional regulator [Chelativorans sp. EGI FJ00035]MCT7376673.1 LysR family transcriptional regulator [Chelativorans sp. EGI FJ00035]